jgi:tetratricopeptide (TPR) repeat protein
MFRRLRSGIRSSASPRRSRSCRAGLRAILLAALAAPAAAQIAAPEDCTAAIARDPALAREDAALWYRSGGGTPARLCEAAALEALGAYGTAAHLLTRTAENPNRAISAPLRRTLFEDAARLWLADGQPGLALETLVAAQTLGGLTRDGALTAARAHAAEEDWPAAQATLAALIADRPEDAGLRALHAAALRRGGDPEAALAEAEAALVADPALPEALFEAGAALAELGRDDAAAARWLALLAARPDHDLAPAARANLQRLGAVE